MTTRDVLTSERNIPSGALALMILRLANIDCHNSPSLHVESTKLIPRANIPKGALGTSATYYRLLDWFTSGKDFYP